MLLRRISKHVKDQNWFAVALDFFIVVAGILIAFQITNWNEGQSNKSLEKQYLERLLTDLNGSLEDYRVTSQWDLRQVQNQYIALQQLRSGVFIADEAEQFEMGLAFAGVLNPQRRRWGTAEELFSTGNITLIKDINLRTTISQTAAFFNRNDALVKDANARMVPLRAELTKKIRIDRFEFTLIDPFADISYDFDALSKDQIFINTLSGIHISSDSVALFSWSSMESIRDLRDELALSMNVDTAGMPELIEFPDRPWGRDKEEQD